MVNQSNNAGASYVQNDLQRPAFPIDMSLPGGAHPRIFPVGNLGEVMPLRERLAQWVTELDIYRDFRDAQKLMKSAGELLVLERDQVENLSSNMGSKGTPRWSACQGICAILERLDSSLSSCLRDTIEALENRREEMGALNSENDNLRWCRTVADVVSSRSLDLQRSMRELSEALTLPFGIYTVLNIQSYLESECEKLKQLCNREIGNRSFRDCSVTRNSILNYCARSINTLLTDTCNKSKDFSGEKTIEDLATLWVEALEQMGVLRLKTFGMLKDLEMVERQIMRARSYSNDMNILLLVNPATEGKYDNFAKPFEKFADKIKDLCSADNESSGDHLELVEEYVNGFRKLAGLRLKFAKLRSTDDPKSAALTEELRSILRQFLAD